MDWLAHVFRKLRLFTGRERFKRELEEEMTFHREQMEGEMRNRRNVAKKRRGMRRCGSLETTTRMKEMSHEVMAFRMETVAQDMGFAARQMRKNPGFAATAIFVLTLGIGAAIAIFSFVDAALIRALAVSGFLEPGHSL